MGFKVTQQSWLLLFAFSPPFFFRFSCLIFFSLDGHLVGFILVGRLFRKAFRILGLGERKGRWVMEQDFHEDFQVLVTWFFASFSGVLDWIVLILVWSERSLHSAQVSEESRPWPLKLMTSQRVERTWIRTGGSGANGLNKMYKMFLTSRMIRLGGRECGMRCFNPTAYIMLFLVLNRRVDIYLNFPK